MNVIHIPATLSADDIAALRAENPDCGFVRIIPVEGAATVTEADGQTVALWTTLAKTILGGAGQLLVPGPWGALVTKIIESGVDNVASLIAKKPLTERWTLEAIRAEEATVALPRT